MAPCIVRRVDLDIANAGKDDGLPTSVLREIAFLTELDSPNIVKILGATVHDKAVTICTEFVDYNLTDYMR
jgi:serine/threonine protein kinase